MPVSNETFESAVYDAYSAGFEAGFKARDRMDTEFGRRRSKGYKFAIEVVTDAIRRMRESDRKTNN
jgi:hypothetical protein